jgi:hypothetical protein
MCAVTPCTGLRRSAIRSSVLIGLALAAASGCASGSSGGQSGAGGGASATGGSAGGGRTGVAGIGFGGSGATGGSGPGGAAGTSGAVGPGGTAGSNGTVGSGGTFGTGGAVGMGGGSAGTGEGGASVGGSMGIRAGAGASGQAGTSTGGQAGTGGIGGVGDLDELYEAEAIPPNQVFGYARADACTPTCTKPLTVGANCCSGTGQVTWIVSENGAHPAGWMQFNAISAPADASYDVTFWYHCGDSDTYGDGDCGGQPTTEPKQTGCRPQVFTVNGTVMPGAYHFPCFPGSWATMYAATVSLPLASGMNTIKIAPPPPRDAVDVDAIEILSPGKGRAPRIAANTTDPLGK